MRRGRGLPGSASEPVEDRFRRLLLLVPYVLKTEGASVQDVCERFGIDRARLIADLNLLFMCGLPGYGPGDLIEAFVDGGTVTIRMADYFARPLRLTPSEGLLLYSGARALEAAGAGSPSLARATERLKEALGAEALKRVAVGVEGSSELNTIRGALESRRRVHMVYQSASKDEVTERDVDPWTVFLSAGHWYLVGWCHLVNDERIFRVDRMRSAEMTAEPAPVPENVDLSRYESLYVESPGAVEVVLEIAPEASWVLDQYPLLSHEPREDGWTRVNLTAGGTAWLERLMLRLGPNATVVEPRWLADRVKQIACRLAERYAT